MAHIANLRIKSNNWSAMGTNVELLLNYERLSSNFVKLGLAGNVSSRDISTIPEDNTTGRTVFYDPGYCIVYVVDNLNQMNAVAIITNARVMGTSIMRPMVAIYALADTGFKLYYGTVNTETIIIPLYDKPEVSANITLTGDNLNGINYNGVNYTNFPQTVPVIDGAIVNANGKNPNHVLTITNGQNMKSIQDDATIYNNFPAAIPISGNKTIIASGEDDKSITVDYTNTSLPIVTNT